MATKGQEIASKMFKEQLDIFNADKNNFVAGEKESGKSELGKQRFAEMQRLREEAEDAMDALIAEDPNWLSVDPQDLYNEAVQPTSRSIDEIKRDRQDFNIAQSQLGKADYEAIIKAIQNSDLRYSAVEHPLYQLSDQDWNDLSTKFKLTPEEMRRVINTALTRHMRKMGTEEHKKTLKAIEDERKSLRDEYDDSWKSLLNDMYYGSIQNYLLSDIDNAPTSWSEALKDPNFVRNLKADAESGALGAFIPTKQIKFVGKVAKKMGPKVATFVAKNADKLGVAGGILKSGLEGVGTETLRQARSTEEFSLPKIFGAGIGGVAGGSGFGLLNQIGGFVRGRGVGTKLKKGTHTAEKANATKADLADELNNVTTEIKMNKEPDPVRMAENNQILKYSETLDKTRGYKKDYEDIYKGAGKEYDDLVKQAFKEAEEATDAWASVIGVAPSSDKYKAHLRNEMQKRYAEIMDFGTPVNADVDRFVPKNEEALKKAEELLTEVSNKKPVGATAPSTANAGVGVKTTHYEHPTFEAKETPADAPKSKKMVEISYDADGNVIGTKTTDVAVDNGGFNYKEGKTVKDSDNHQIIHATGGSTTWNPSGASVPKGHSAEYEKAQANLRREKNIAEADIDKQRSEFDANPSGANDADREIFITNAGFSGNYDGADDYVMKKLESKRDHLTDLILSTPRELRLRMRQEPSLKNFYNQVTPEEVKIVENSPRDIDELDLLLDNLQNTHLYSSGDVAEQVGKDLINGIAKRPARRGGIVGARDFMGDRTEEKETPKPQPEKQAHGVTYNQKTPESVKVTTTPKIKANPAKPTEPSSVVRNKVETQEEKEARWAKGIYKKGEWQSPEVNAFNKKRMSQTLGVQPMIMDEEVEIQ